MKKIILITSIMCLSIVLFAQNDTTAKWQYAELLGTSKLMSLKVTLSIDYGQERSFWHDSRLRDENGKIETFNSMVDAMNYMGQNGWEFVQAYIVGAGPYVYHWLMKKKIVNI